MSVIVRDVSKRMGKNDVLRNVSIEVDWDRGWASGDKRFG